MKDKILIFSIAGFIIIILGVIAHLQYFQTKGNVIKLYSEKQTTLALQAATSLQSYIQERIKMVELLANVPTQIRSDNQLYLNEFTRVYNAVTGFQHIFYVNAEGLTVFGYPDGYPCPIDQPEEIQLRFRDTFDQAVRLKKTLTFERNVLVDGKVTACLLTPVYSHNNEFIGAIIGALDIKEALYDALQPIMIGSNNHAWVINEPGYLIYHPAHEEVLIQNLFKTRNQCFDCHFKFKTEKEMFSGQSGFGIIEDFKLPKQLISYAQVQLENTRWLVAISTPFETLTTSLRSEFRNFLFLIIAIIVTVISGAFLVNRINTKHITTKKELESLKVQASLISQRNAAESRYRILVEQSPDPIFLCTRKKVLMVNKSFEKLFGYNEDEICDSNFLFLDLVESSSHAIFNKTIERVVRNREQISSITLHMLDKTGNSLEVEISLSRFFLGKKVVYQGIIHDITKIRKLEREREHRNHLAILGEMAARIAHEIKNPLASIQTGIQLLESQITDNGIQKSYYERLRGEIQRVDSILKGLLSYARDDQINAKVTRIEPIVNHFKELIKPTIEKQNIKLLIRVGENLPRLYLDEQKIEQVLWNICLNAIQTSKSGRKIFLNVMHIIDGVQLQIRDEGSGIPPENLDKIFQPFFSTRSHGTGLGLAISKKIIEMHHGRIVIESKLKQGTIVNIYLPEVNLNK